MDLVPRHRTVVEGQATCRGIVHRPHPNALGKWALKICKREFSPAIDSCWSGFLTRHSFPVSGDAIGGTPFRSFSGASASPSNQLERKPRVSNRNEAVGPKAVMSPVHPMLSGSTKGALALG